MSESIPPELVNRCAAIQDSEAQGLPLAWSDYAWFGMATVIVPAILVILGVVL